MKWTRLGDVVKKRRQTFERCRCECGRVNLVRVVGGNLTSQQCNHCKALRHGHFVDGKPTPEYHSWQAAKQRVARHPDYAGRGIRMCERWLHGFSAFLEDMGPRPQGTTLDRKDVNGDYEPGNCRWATWSEQSNNKRNSMLLEFRGETMTCAQWARRYGMTRSKLHHRIRKGWSIERALTA